MLFDLIDPLLPPGVPPSPLIAPLPQVLRTFEKHYSLLEEISRDTVSGQKDVDALMRIFVCRDKEAAPEMKVHLNEIMTLANIPDDEQWVYHKGVALKLRIASQKQMPHLGPMVVAEDSNGLGVRLVCTAFGVKTAIPLCKGTQITLSEFEVDRRDPALPFLRIKGPQCLSFDPIMNPSRTAEDWLTEGRTQQEGHNDALAYYCFRQALWGPSTTDPVVRKTAACGLCVSALKLGDYHTVLTLTEPESIIPDEVRRVLRSDAYWRLGLYEEAESALDPSEDAGQIESMASSLGRPLVFEELLHVCLGGWHLPDRLEAVTVEAHRVKTLRDFKAGDVIFTEAAVCTGNPQNGLEDEAPAKPATMGPLWVPNESSIFARGVSLKGRICGPMPMMESLQWMMYYNPTRWYSVEEALPTTREWAGQQSTIYQQCLAATLDEPPMRMCPQGYRQATEGTYGIFDVLSHVEPRCEHNCDVLFVGKNAVVRATRDLKAGEYLTRYAGCTQSPGEWVSNHERNSLKEARCYEVCDCQICKYDAEHPHVDQVEAMALELVIEHIDEELEKVITKEGSCGPEELFAESWVLADKLEKAYEENNRPQAGRCLLFRVLRGAMIAARLVGGPRLSHAARRIVDIFEGMNLDILQLPAYQSEVISAYATLPDRKKKAAELFSRYYALGTNYYELFFNSFSVS